MGCESSRPTPKDTKNEDQQTLSTSQTIRKHKFFDSEYSLGHKIGVGNFSVVRSGTHKQTGEKYAVKIVKRHQLSVEDEEALLMEAQVLRSLKGHPNIVQIVDFFEEKDYYFLVLELMKGGELFDRIVEKQVYNEKEARDVLRTLLTVIFYCHERGIVHRDLKPENLLLVSKEDNSDIKVSDFGFAREVKNGLYTQCGTPGFVAPEILYGYKYGLAVDMWSIGVICYILLGGYPPFQDENKSILYKKIKRGRFTFHRKYWVNVSDDAKDLIRKLLQLNPEQRLTAKEALQHSWLIEEDDRLANNDLKSNLTQLRLFNARRKFKSTIRTVILTNQLSRTPTSVQKSTQQSPEVSLKDIQHTLSLPL
eukprot:366045_1